MIMIEFIREIHNLFISNLRGNNKTAIIRQGIINLKKKEVNYGI